MKLIASFNNFIQAKRLKNLSAKSIRNYTDFLLPLIRHFGKNCLIENLTREDVDLYILSLYAPHRSTGTVATYIRNTKIFLRWIDDKYSLGINAKSIEVPKTPKKFVKIYSDSEIKQIFSAITCDSPWMTVRNRTIVFLMLDSGLRQNEICTLERINVDYERHTLKIHGKGNKERNTFIGNTSLTLLNNYMELRPFESDYVFVSKYGEQMTPDSIKHLISKIKSKLPFEFSSHKLRHNFATNFCIDQYTKNGHVDIFQLMNLMGHEDLSTTQRYLHHAMSILAAAENNSHIDSILQDII